MEFSFVIILYFFSLTEGFSFDNFFDIALSFVSSLIIDKLGFAYLFLFSNCSNPFKWFLFVFISVGHAYNKINVKSSLFISFFFLLSPFI